jgi:hypothetical protein
MATITERIAGWAGDLEYKCLILEAFDGAKGFIYSAVASAVWRGPET